MNNPYDNNQGRKWLRKAQTQKNRKRKNIHEKKTEYVHSILHLGKNQIKLRKGEVITIVRTSLSDNTEKLVVGHAVVPVRTKNKTIPAPATQAFTFFVIIFTFWTKHISTVGCMKEWSLRA